MVGLVVFPFYKKPTVERGEPPLLLVVPIIAPHLPVAGFAATTGTSHGMAGDEGRAYLLAAMREFGGPDHLVPLVVDQGQSRGAAARIDLEAQRGKLWLWHGCLQDHGKRVAFPHGSLA